MKSRFKVAAVGLGVGAAMLASACGSSSSPRSASSPTPITSGLTGSPLKIALILDPPSPGEGISNSAVITAGVKAAADAVNASGGIKGHPIQVITCSTNNDPNGAAACARQAVSEGAIANVGSATTYSSSVVPVLNAAHIASIGGYAVSQADLTNPDGYTFAPASITLVPGEANLAASQGAKKISLAIEQLPSTAQLAALAALGLAPYHLKVAGSVQVPTGAPDMSTYAASAMANGTDAVCVVLPPSDELNFIKALKAAGFAGKVVADATTLQRDIYSGFGSTVEGVYSVDEFKPASDTSDPSVKRMVSDFQASGYKGVIDLAAEDGWASVELFAQAARGAAALDAPSLLAGMPTLTNFNVGIMPTVNFSKPITALPGLHVFNPYVLYEQVRSGNLVPLASQFTDFFPGPPGG